MLALDHVDEMEARVAGSSRSGDGRERRSTSSRSTCGRRGRTSCCSGHGRPVRASQVWQGLVDRSVLVRNCASWPRLPAVCVSPSAPGGERRASSTPLAASPEVHRSRLDCSRRGWRRSRCATGLSTPAAKVLSDHDRVSTPPDAPSDPPASHRTRPPETDITIELDLDGTGSHRRRPACRSSTTCSTSSAATAASTSPCRPPATSQIDAHHTVEDTGILLGEVLAEAWATRPVSAASPPCGSRSTRRWSTSPSTCRAARSWSTTSIRRARRSWATRRSTRS